MDECDLEAEQALTWLLVDQLRTGRSQLVECLADVVDLVRDVVHPLSALLEEASDRRVGTERRKQLDAAVTQPHRRRLDALLGDRLAMLQLAAEEPGVRLERLLQVVHGHAEMMDATGLHWARCYLLRGDGPHGADGLGRAGLRLDRAEHPLELVARQRLALE